LAGHARRPQCTIQDEAKSKQAGKTDYKVQLIEQSTVTKSSRRHGASEQGSQTSPARSADPGRPLGRAAQAEDAGRLVFLPLSASVDRRCDQAFQPLDDQRFLVRAISSLSSALTRAVPRRRQSMVKRFRHGHHCRRQFDLGAEDPQRLAGLETAGCQLMRKQSPAGRSAQRVGMQSADCRPQSPKWAPEPDRSLAASQPHRTQIIGNRAAAWAIP